MIISASRRTDIPAFYSQWFFNRIKEGYVLVPNPFNPKMISKVSLHPAVVDCIVFWTKNPAPMIDKLDHLQDYKYYFQFTLNPYGEKLENNLPSIDKRIDIFKRLSDKIGKEKVIWRYDPILTNEEYDVSFHKEDQHEILHDIHFHVGAGNLKTIPKSVCWDLLTITSISAPQSASSTYSRCEKRRLKK